MQKEKLEKFQVLTKTNAVNFDKIFRYFLKQNFSQKFFDLPQNLFVIHYFFI